VADTGASSATILVVDDEESISELVRMALEREGFERVLTAATVAQALELVHAENPALVVLDVMLPDGTGFEAATQIRKFSAAPILFLTARDSDLDKLTGFGVGGDDYVTKPFNPLEIAARVKAHVRRATGAAGADAGAGARVFECGDFRLAEDEGRLTVGGTDIAIPAREFQLLAFLCKNPGRVFSKRQLYRQVWGEEALGEADDNTVQVHVHRLREKIEPVPSDPRYLVTVRGLGYKLVVPRGDGR
jgi:DNA-binding response OmpR family regulator